MKIEQLFDNKFDCYADQKRNEEDVFKKEDLATAMSKGRFVDVVYQLLSDLDVDHKTIIDLPLVKKKYYCAHWQNKCTKQCVMCAKKKADDNEKQLLELAKELNVRNCRF